MKTLYWLITFLAAGFIVMSAVPDLTKSQPALDVFSHLGYPVYLLPFLGSLKIAGAIVMLIPSAVRLKEWAYAGIVFDLLGALYSHLQVGDVVTAILPCMIALILVSCSYVLHRMRQRSAS
jgi:hypothetical protein